VLLSLADGDQHGYGIMQEVLDRTGGKIRLWPATLYGTLKRLIDAELIEESDVRPAPEADDARRRYYRLTLSGRRVLAAESQRLEDLVRVIRSKRSLSEAES
jgi:DNA-binding PadR family transcriptional regulator